MFYEQQAHKLYMDFEGARDIAWSKPNSESVDGGSVI